jgi:AcrR family transcriptional regulator
MKPLHLQDRSRETASRLLQAAEEILEQRGLERASVPEIAARAGVSPASIYRRFKDKDGLLRQVFEHFFERSISANEAALQPERWSSASLEETIRALICAMVTGYSQKRGLLRAVITYGEQHPDPAFRRRARRLRNRSIQGIEAIILLHAKEICHPEPKKAVAFGLQLIVLALRERILPARAKYGTTPLSEKELQRELSRLLLGYLRCAGRSS